MKNVISFKNKEQEKIDELLKASEEASENYKATCNQFELKANNGKVTMEDAEKFMQAFAGTLRAATNLEEELIEAKRLEPMKEEQEKQLIEKAMFGDQ